MVLYEVAGVMVVCTAAICSVTDPVLGKKSNGPSTLCCHLSVVRASTSGAPLKPDRLT